MRFVIIAFWLFWAWLAFGYDPYSVSNVNGFNGGKTFFQWSWILATGAVIFHVVKGHLGTPQKGDHSRTQPPNEEFQNTSTPNDSGDFEYDASAFEGAGDDVDDKLWNMAQDPRTPEPERQAAMKAIQKRGAKPKQITHRKV